MADISSELGTIHDDPLGKNVKLAIYSALYKVNEDVEHWTPATMTWPIGHMSTCMFNGYCLPFVVGKMGENPNTECIWLVPSEFSGGITPARDSWCIAQATIQVSTEDPSYETGTISDSGSHTWTNIANYKLLADEEGNEFVYVHIWITRVYVGESITVSGDRNYNLWGFLIQDGVQAGTVSVIGTDVPEQLPYISPRFVDPDTYTITAHLVTVASFHNGDGDDCPVSVASGYGTADRYPEYGDGWYSFLFLRTDADPESESLVFEANPDTQEDPFFPGNIAITTFALR